MSLPALSTDIQTRTWVVCEGGFLPFPHPADKNIFELTRKVFELTRKDFPAVLDLAKTVGVPEAIKRLSNDIAELHQDQTDVVKWCQDHNKTPDPELLRGFVLTINSTLLTIALLAHRSFKFGTRSA